MLTNTALITLTGPFTTKLYGELPNHLAKKVLQPNYEVNLLSTALGMTAKNLGITVCLPYAADWVKQQQLQMRLLTDPIISRRFFIYQRNNRALSPVVEIFKDFLNFQKLSY